MKFTVKHQESYSRGQLLLRAIFGAIYIQLPHNFVRMFVGIWFNIQSMLLPWVILFTGNMPASWFEFRVKYMRWGLRVNASIMNLTDEYPSFGVDGVSESVELEMEQPESLSRLLNFLSFIKVIAIIPSVFLMMFVGIWVAIINVLGFWIILFTGKFPEGLHTTVVNFMRWSTKIQLYTGFMTDEYPGFSGKAE